MRPGTATHKRGGGWRGKELAVILPTTWRSRGEGIGGADLALAVRIRAVGGGKLIGWLAGRAPMKAGGECWAIYSSVRGSQPWGEGDGA